MVAPQRRRVAARARLTVEEPVPPPDAADAAVVAVVLPPVDVVEEAAAKTNIGAECDAAAPARRGGALPLVAETADDLADGRALELVPLGRVPLVGGLLVFLVFF